MGLPDLTHVYQRVCPYRGFIRGAFGPETLLGLQTSIVIENHYLGAVLDRHQFWLIRSITSIPEPASIRVSTSFDFIAKSLGLDIVDVEAPARYGGNIRVTLGPRCAEREGQGNRERGRCARKTSCRISASSPAMCELWKDRKGREIKQIVAQHGPIRAKAFPGRAAILVKLLGLTEKEIVAVHEKPGSIKIGHYVPGTRIPIVSDDLLFSTADHTSPLLNLAWHISGEIRQYLADNGYKRSGRRRSRSRGFSCLAPGPDSRSSDPALGSTDICRL